MKRLFDILSIPLHFSIMIGSFLAVLTFSIGSHLITAKTRAAVLEGKNLAQKIGTQLLLIEREGENVEKEELIRNILSKNSSNSFVNEINVTLEKEIFSKKNPRFKFNKNQLNFISLPLVTPTGKKIGHVKLSSNFNTPQTIFGSQAKLILLSLLMFLCGSAVSLFLILHRDKVVSRLEKAICHILAGRLESPIEETLHPSWVKIIKGINSIMDMLKERERMRHSLGRIMDPKIAEILIKENPKLGGLRRQATILFCDIRNYTTICEQLSVDELQLFLNEYWKGTVEIIMEQEGTIDKFHGDGVCVIFGAPALHEDDPLRAVRAAHRLVNNVETLNKKRALERKIPIQIGIGIHTGEVIAGNIGSEKRMDYTVVGDVVNVAARIEELNKKYGTKILISDEVYEKVESHVHVKTLSLAHLRGHKRPILVHALRDFLEIIEESEKKAA